MYILILLLLVPFLLIVFFGLIALLFAWSSVMKLWYSITGKKPKQQDFFQRSGQRTQTNHTEQRTQTRQDTQSGGQKQKIFSENDGEYVDFEIVE